VYVSPVAEFINIDFGPVEPTFKVRHLGQRPAGPTIALHVTKTLILSCLIEILQVERGILLVLYEGPICGTYFSSLSLGDYNRTERGEFYPSLSMSSLQQ
jgi:hypothetical protein